MDEIKKSINSYIKERFPSVPKTKIADALRQLAADYSKLEFPEPTPAEESSQKYEIWANTKDEVFRLLRDTLTIGAVIFDKITNVENLHADVVVELHIPSEHVHLVTKGRIIHIYETGTAVELPNLTPNDRATLEPIYDRARRGDSDPSVVEENVKTEEKAPAKQVELRVPLRNVGGTPPTFPPPNRPFQFAGSSQKAESPQKVTRLFDVPVPDESVINASDDQGDVTKAPAVATTNELFGPATPWITPTSGPDRQESLSEDRIRDIIMQIVYESFTGIVECAHDERRYQLKFENGLFVEVAAFPRIPELEFGPMIRDANHIDSSQLAMASAYADENKIEIERAFVDLQILDVPKIRSAIAGRLTFFLKRILNWKSGKLRIYKADKCAPDFLPKPPLRVHVVVEKTLFSMFYDETKALDRQKRERLVFAHLESYPEISPDDRECIARALTEPEHIALIERISTTRRRLQEVITESAISNIETLSVLWALYRMGLLRFDTSLHQTIVRERFREKVTVKYLSVHKASYFEVLNVHWSSYDEVVEAAYKDLCQQFDPDSVPDQLEPEVLERVIEIRQQIDDAYSVLSSRETRHAYRKRVMPKYKLAHAIPLFLKQIELAMQRNDIADAKDNVLRVLEIEPDNVRAKRLLKSLTVDEPQES